VRPADLASATRLFGSGAEARLALLRAVWPLAVGQEIAQRTQVVALAGDVLTVRVADTRWRQVLSRMRRELVSRLRRSAGDLAPRRLGFMEGPRLAATPAEAEAPAPRLAAPPQGPEALPAEVDTAAQAIPDPDLRQAFARAAARYLERAGSRSQVGPKSL
jgi:hypothetical protein